MKLIFVYNADSGPASALRDVLWKEVKADTYPCKLCQITYGHVAMKNEWKLFVRNLKDSYGVEFLHRNEFHKKYDKKYQALYEFPVVLGEENEKLEVIIDRMEFEEMTSVMDLTSSIQTKMEERKNRSSVKSNNE